MGRIPIEDNVVDVINKAQRGYKVTDEELCRRAEVSPAQFAEIKSGRGEEAPLRRIAQHLKLNGNALVQLAQQSWYPAQPNFPRGFAAFNTPYDDLTVNSYLIWDSRTRLAACFDTGTSCEAMLDVIGTENLHLRDIFLTHTHPDHIADLPKLVEKTGAQVWSSSLEPVDFPGAKVFSENAFFHAGTLSIKAISTAGHSPGSTTYLVNGLSYPLAIVGDSVFSCSLGGSQTAFVQGYENVLRKIMRVFTADTVLASGHGPLTTVGQERRNNPFFAH